MREIKFRAWDKERNEMVYFDLGHKDGLLYACGEWQVATGYDSEDNPTFDDDNVPRRYELMQFTGLHDKNGKEIYEGDVLESPDWACLSIVEWRKGGFVIPQGEYGNIIGYELESHYERYPDSAVRVIGNIYENGDLLT